MKELPYKIKKFNLNRKIFHVKTLGAIRSSNKNCKNNLKLEWWLIKINNER